MKRLAPWFRFAVTAVLLAWILRTVDLKAMAAVLAKVSWPVIALVLLLTALDRALMIAKWLPLLRIQAPEVAWWRAARVYLAANFSGVFLPSLAADVLRGLALGRGRRAVPEIGASIFAERIFGMLGGSVLCVVALALILREPIERGVIVPWALIAIFAPAAIWILSLAAPRLSRVGLDRALPGAGMVRRFATAYGIYGKHPRTLFWVGVASVIEQTMPIWIFSLIVVSLQGSIEPKLLWIAIPLVLFAARMPFTLWGLGVAEGGMIYLLGLFGVPAGEALALALVGRLSELIILIPGAWSLSSLMRRNA